MGRVLLITIAIGDSYKQFYDTMFRKSQEEYAKKHGYDFMVIEDYLCKIPEYNCKTTLTFNKLLVCSQPFSVNYDYIIFVDADIFITYDAPPIIEGFHALLGDKIGVVNELYQPNKENCSEIQKLCTNYKTDIYYSIASNDIQDVMTNAKGMEIIINSGFFISQPKKHHSFLENIFYNYVPNALTKNLPYYEQVVFGYELLKQDKYYILPSCWNAIRPHYKNAYKHVPNYLSIYKYWYDNYFLHFAGHEDENCVFVLEKLNENPGRNPEDLRHMIVDNPTMFYTTQEYNLLNVIQSIIYTECNNNQYIYNHAMTNKTIIQWLNLNCNYKSYLDRKINDEVCFYTNRYIDAVFSENIDKYLSSESCYRLKKVFWENKVKPFTTMDINIVIVYENHRLLDYYYNIIKIINEKFNKGYMKLKIHVYSYTITNIAGKNVVHHLNTSFDDIFIAMVAADILLLTNSELSYTAALLCNGTILYPNDNPYKHAKKWISF